jgi:hypothetical protein
MRRFSGDPSALIPEAVDVGVFVSPVIDISEYQKRTYSLCRSGANGVADYNAFWDSDEELNPIRQARAFRVTGVTYVFDNDPGSDTDYWVNGWFDLGVPGGGFEVPYYNTFAVVRGPAYDHRISAENDRLNQTTFDQWGLNHTGVWIGEQTRPQIEQINLRFRQSLGPGLIRVNNVAVHFELFY